MFWTTSSPKIDYFPSASDKKTITHRNSTYVRKNFFQRDWITNLPEEKTKSLMKMEKISDDSQFVVNFQLSPWMKKRFFPVFSRTFLLPLEKQKEKRRDQEEDRNETSDRRETWKPLNFAFDVIFHANGTIRIDSTRTNGVRRIFSTDLEKFDNPFAERKHLSVRKYFSFVQIDSLRPRNTNWAFGR